MRRAAQRPAPGPVGDTTRPRFRETRRGSCVRTFSPKADDITRAWHVVDADGLVLGRLATEVAARLRGKHKPTFAPHIDTGDHVIVVNAAKVSLTSDKADKKFVFSHSGYPGGITKKRYGDLLSDRPEEVVRRAVRGMLPRTRLGRQQLNKLKVYAGAEHPHEAQQPQALDLPGARARS
jgi:large subunit ribosomal protein L13